MEIKKGKQIVADLIRYEKTELERSLDKEFGYKERTVFEDITETYRNKTSEFGTTNIQIRTKLVKPQIYKVGAGEIEVIN